jgi:hypothetical protein
MFLPIVNIVLRKLRQLCQSVSKKCSASNITLRRFFSARIQKQISASVVESASIADVIMDRLGWKVDTTV